MTLQYFDIIFIYYTYTRIYSTSSSLGIIINILGALGGCSVQALHAGCTVAYALVHAMPNLMYSCW